MSCGYILLEFHDGLQLVPAIYSNDDKQSCFWPSHYKTKLRINTAIIRQKIPKNELDWEKLPVKRMFAVADEENKENRHIKKKKLPPFPQLQDYISSKPIMSEVIENINTSHKGTFIDKTYNKSSVSRQCILNSSIYAENTVIEDTSNEETTNKRYNSSVSGQCIPSSSIYAEKTVIDADMNKENVSDALYFKAGWWKQSTYNDTQHVKKSIHKYFSSTVQLGW